MQLPKSTEIRTATVEDFPRIREIWQIVFGDTAEYIDFFLQQRCVPQMSFLLETDGVIVSQLFLLPAQLNIAGQMRSVQYLFAAATLPEYRGRGYMSDLLRYVAKRFTSGIVLKPGEESLYNYYEKFGYKTVFFENVWQGSRKALEDLAENADISSDSPVPELLSYQARHDGIVWSESALEYAVQEHRRYRGVCAVTQGAVVMQSEVSTIFADAAMLRKGIGALLELTDAQDFTLVLPPDIPMGERQRGGMLYTEEDFSMGDAFLSFPMD